jgi:hypothetical protein
MVAAISSIHETDRHVEALVNEVVKVFIDLLVASGASTAMIKSAIAKSNESSMESGVPARFTDLGGLLRDCMEVMCTWRREVEFVNSDGEPKLLAISGNPYSFETLCRKSDCRNPSSEILQTLIDFGAVSITEDGCAHSETPTFLLGRASSGGRLATDALLKQIEGFLFCVHRNLRSVAGMGKAKFERACTVTVALELEPIFDQLVRYRGQEFIDSIDEWLERNTRFESPSGRYVELGAGAYYIDLGERVGRKRVPKNRDNYTI